jgi:hypothetical protein
MKNKKRNEKIMMEMSMVKRFKRNKKEDSTTTAVDESLYLSPKMMEAITEHKMNWNWKMRWSERSAREKRHFISYIIIFCFW